MDAYQNFCKQLLSIISCLHEQNAHLQKQQNTGRIPLLPSIPLFPGVPPHHHQLQQPSGSSFPRQPQVPGSSGSRQPQVPGSSRSQQHCQKQSITHLPRPGSSFSSKEVANALALPETNGWLFPNHKEPQGTQLNNRWQETPMHPSVAQFYKYLARPNFPPNPYILSPVNGSALNAQLRLKAPAESSASASPLGQNNPLSLQIPHFTEMGSSSTDGTRKKSLEMLRGPDDQLPEKLRHLEPHLLERIIYEIMDTDLNVCWDDIAGLEHAKKSVTQMVVWPLMRPDIFKGCRDLGSGLLLFGPPGTCKTMMAKTIAGEMKAAFFHLSARTLATKWVADSEKVVRTLFGIARCMQPAVIFCDEIDLILNKSTTYAHQYSRRLKMQFLTEMESMDNKTARILLIGATSRPHDLDEVALKHLTRRLHMPLPSPEARSYIISNLLKKDGLFSLSEKDLNTICCLTEGYSGSDMAILVKTAAMGPLRDAMKEGFKDIENLEAEKLRAVTLEDFWTSMQAVRPSVSPNETGAHAHWNLQFGSMSL
ncbi:ATPase family AAA domain-containing protein FIGL1-like [Populus nigra]|uniref:ATPase family AAA domain-containing protein FIGL1-like n=1 Tax=Populus nigra TaxID=3691 RepID=UPI002B274E62|nr:ATPase family AAA domain-containing protein FIGL1-like [Populus nigra]